MSIVKSDFGPMIKKSGNHYFKVVDGKNIMCKQPLRVRNPNTDKQKIQRTKWATVIAVSKQFSPAYKIGFKGLRNGCKPYNNFVKFNLDNVQVDENFEATFDFNNLSCSKGDLIAPEVEILLSEDKARIMINAQEVQTWAQKDDEVYIIFYEKVVNQMKMVSGRQRGTSGVSGMDYPKGWKKENIVCYSFAVSASGKDSSNTIVVTPRIEEE